MTDVEKNIICNQTGEGLKKLKAEDIGELMHYVTRTPGSEKIGNVLYDAIVKAFILGYYRGQKNKC